ncbi:uncharacterized protein LOC125064547 [Vanessa atalanta]|uniref:uncharacterized protein LOC125064547 n=1 Tax=Vanessa atalanta TaxID=42275 RepID=UPI001FCDFDE7|nr:uncharacterized protein LOC125064547 [Vanessa atalanta]
MGGNISKSSTETAALTQKNDLDKDTSNNSDPRSPTPEITRTPLQNKNGAKHNITKNVDLRKTFENGKTEEKLIHNNPILSAVIKNHLQSYDPRSPTQDFERTPIVLSSKIEDNQKLIKENNFGSPCLNNDTMENNNYDSSFEINDAKPSLAVPKNLCDGFYDMTLNGTLNETEEPLGSSTASNEVIQNNISKECAEPPQLLETDFEYIETGTETFEDSEEHIEFNNKDYETPDYDVKNVPLFKILQEDPRSPSIGIERTPIVVSKIEEDVSEENVEEMSDDSLLKVLQTTKSEPQQNEEQDGILIYEDESITLDKTPKKSKSASNSGSRTPLSCMKNKADSTHARSKSTNTLYDSINQKVTKSQKRISHIPRLKSLTKQSSYIGSESSLSLKTISKTTAISGDCENTPPHSHRDRWDKDNSIVL